MGKFKEFLNSGHAPTLFASFLYFDFCFAVWVLNGAMAPFISDTFNLTPSQKGLMISVPIMAGALMRFPLGILAQYIGRKNAALVEMSLIFCAMIYGYLMVNTFHDVLAMGVLLGIAGASFGVALSLGSGWFPAKHKGLAMGIAGAGNSGTVLAVLFAPPLAIKYGWQTVYGFAAIAMLLPIFVMIIFAKEPPDREHQTLKQHMACLLEKDGWVFNLIYIVTFGGFIGLASFLPTFFYDRFGVSKVEAGQLTMLAAVMGSGVRIIGGHVSDKIGGIRTLMGVFFVIIAVMIFLGNQDSLVITTIGFMLCFAALGAGNGALFQLVPLRWPTTTAIAGSMIGEIGALGGSIIPMAMGMSMEYHGTYEFGFYIFSALGVFALTVLYISQKSWVKSWVAEGGRARVKSVQDNPKTIYETDHLDPSAYFKNVIYPVGDSELAEKTSEVTAQLIKMSGAKLNLIYVEEKWYASEENVAQGDSWEQIRGNWIKEGERVLSLEVERFKKLGVTNIHAEVRTGEMAKEIVRCAKDKNAQLIILASHKRSPLGELLMGHRTFNVFKYAECPILRVVR